MSKRDRGIAGYSRREVLEGAQGLPPPCLSLILREVPHNVSCLCGFPGLVLLSSGWCPEPLSTRRVLLRSCTLSFVLALQGNSGRLMLYSLAFSA